MIVFFLAAMVFVAAFLLTVEWLFGTFKRAMITFGVVLFLIWWWNSLV